MKKIEDLAAEEIFLFPKEYTTNDYREYLKSIFDKYDTILNELDFDDFLGRVKGLGGSIDKEYVLRTNKEFRKGIIKALDSYLDGYPHQAFNEISTVLSLNTSGKDFSKILKFRNYQKSTDFFRIRQSKENFLLEKGGLFHIPFEKRGFVSPQRFSIQGFPSLYLGTTLYVCWEELKRVDINDVHIIRLSNDKDIKFLDLTPVKFPEKGEEITKEFYSYFMAFPLLAACLVKVKNMNANFKPEYIIPQLLLQWIRENKDVDGIRYLSTNISKRQLSFEGEYHNLVLPVKSKNLTKGYCSSLLDMFSSTEVFSLPTYKAQRKVDNLVTVDAGTGVSKRISTLSMINGLENQYLHSEFGQFEQMLCSMKISPMNESLNL